MALPYTLTDYVEFVNPVGPVGLTNHPATGLLDRRQLTFVSVGADN
jgi:hypothetical protein